MFPPNVIKLTGRLVAHGETLAALPFAAGCLAPGADRFGGARHRLPERRQQVAEGALP